MQLISSVGSFEFWSQNFFHKPSLLDKGLITNHENGTYPLNVDDLFQQEVLQPYKI